MTKIALFPIPDCVVYPHMVLPLHVFEPRYRAMVNYCLESDTMIGVCHTRKLVSKGREANTVEEALHTNQATYKPHEVFSAGQCELVDTMDDGRLRINVRMRGRFQLIEELQTIPYTIAACDSYDDAPMDQQQLTHAEQYQEKVIQRLLALTSTEPDVQKKLDFTDWKRMAPTLFSYDILQVVRLPADMQQRLLEMRSPVDRLAGLLDVLNQIRL